ncbi:MAG: EF2563 family selenium-dependent molybdenum hydroxylase system protein [Caldilineales bacterium]|nr:EF2563 family selenium-dependent molybdenum hydroxylase system protein [Caldilineales bacterium]
MLFSEYLVLVRGAGDLATGVIHRLHLAGFPVIATEVAQPLAVRRTVSFAQAVYDGEHTVEGVTARRVDALEQARSLAITGSLPVLALPSDDVIAELRPSVLVDARLLKRSDAASRAQANLVIGLGPGFTADHNCHAVVETQRGHNLGRVLWQGSPAPNSGVPGIVAGFGEERVLRAPAPGTFAPELDIGDRVEAGQLVGYVIEGRASHLIRAQIPGLIRGLLYPGLAVSAGMKLGDIDPRFDVAAVYTISDKSLAIGGAVLTAILTWLNSDDQHV